MTATNQSNRILLGLGVGLGAGILTLALGGPFPWLLKAARGVAETVLDPIGQVFLRLLFFVVIPLVFASLASGVAQLGRLDRLGPLAGRTFVVFFSSMGVAVALGLVMMNLLNPGGHLPDATKVRLMAEYGAGALKHVEAHAASSAMTPAALVEMFLPRNLLGAVTGQNRGALGEVLPLIVFAILTGAAGTMLAEDKRLALQRGLDLVAELMTVIVNFALKLAPYAVPAMIYSVIVKVGAEIVLALGLFVVGCVFVLSLHLFGTMSVWIRLFAKESPAAFFRTVRSVLITAFSTSSSSATLPAALVCAREQLGVRSSVSGFVLSLGATMNMSGTALYEGCVVLFVAQIFGVDLSLAQQCVLLLLSVLSAVAVAGIPGGSLPLIAGLLTTFGIPPEGIGIVLGVDRLLDMIRTMVNVGSDMTAAVVVDRWMPADPVTKAETAPDEDQALPESVLPEGVSSN